MVLEYLTVGPFQENSYILGCPTSRRAVLIDPGHEPDAILRRVERLGLTVTAIVNTHAHIDHMAGVVPIQKKLGVPFRLNRADLPLLQAAPQHAVLFGLPPVEVPEVESFFTDGEHFPVGELDVEVIFTPGHSPGHVTFRVGEDLIVGDVLFAGSIGRVDLPGGDGRALEHSIKARLFPLGDQFRVWPGHGEPTTIGAERLHNPYVGENAGPGGWPEAG